MDLRFFSLYVCVCVYIYIYIFFFFATLEHNVSYVKNSFHSLSMSTRLCSLKKIKPHYGVSLLFYNNVKMDSLHFFKAL